MAEEKKATDESSVKKEGEKPLEDSPKFEDSQKSEESSKESSAQTIVESSELASKPDEEKKEEVGLVIDSKPIESATTEEPKKEETKGEPATSSKNEEEPKPKESEVGTGDAKVEDKAIPATIEEATTQPPEIPQNVVELKHREVEHHELPFECKAPTEPSPASEEVTAELPSIEISAAPVNLEKQSTENADSVMKSDAEKDGKPPTDSQPPPTTTPPHEPEIPQEVVELKHKEAEHHELPFECTAPTEPSPASDEVATPSNEIKEQGENKSEDIPKKEDEIKEQQSVVPASENKESEAKPLEVAEKAAKKEESSNLNKSSDEAKEKVEAPIEIKQESPLESAVSDSNKTSEEDVNKEKATETESKESGSTTENNEVPVQAADQGPPKPAEGVIESVEKKSDETVVQAYATKAEEKVETKPITENKVEEESQASGNQTDVLKSADETKTNDNVVPESQEQSQNKVDEKPVDSIQAPTADSKEQVNVKENQENKVEETPQELKILQAEENKEKQPENAGDLEKKDGADENAKQAEIKVEEAKPEEKVEEKKVEEVKLDEKVEEKKIDEIKPSEDKPAPAATEAANASPEHPKPQPTVNEAVDIVWICDDGTKSKAEAEKDVKKEEVPFTPQQQQESEKPQQQVEQKFEEPRKQANDVVISPSVEEKPVEKVEEVKKIEEVDQIFKMEEPPKVEANKVQNSTPTQQNQSEQQKNEALKEIESAKPVEEPPKAEVKPVETTKQEAPKSTFEDGIEWICDDNAPKVNKQPEPEPLKVEAKPEPPKEAPKEPEKAQEITQISPESKKEEAPKIEPSKPEEPKQNAVEIKPEVPKSDAPRPEEQKQPPTNLGQNETLNQKPFNGPEIRESAPSPISPSKEESSIGFDIDQYERRMSEKTEEMKALVDKLFDKTAEAKKNNEELARRALEVASDQQAHQQRKRVSFDAMTFGPIGGGLPSHVESVLLGKGILVEPTGVDILPDGNILVTDKQKGIFLFSIEGEVVKHLENESWKDPCAPYAHRSYILMVQTVRNGDGIWERMICKFSLDLNLIGRIECPMWIKENMPGVVSERLCVSPMENIYLTVNADRFTGLYELTPGGQWTELVYKLDERFIDICAFCVVPPVTQVLVVEGRNNYVHMYSIINSQLAERRKLGVVERPGAITQDEEGNLFVLNKAAACIFTVDTFSWCAHKAVTVVDQITHFACSRGLIAVPLKDSVRVQRYEFRRH